MSETGQPPRATLVKWLRLNLGLTAFIWGIVCAGLGAYGTVTWRVASFDFRLDAVEHSQSGIVVDLAAAAERRIVLADSMGIINQRLGILESRVQWLGAQTPEKRR